MGPAQRTGCASACQAGLRSLGRNGVRRQRMHTRGRCCRRRLAGGVREDRGARTNQDYEITGNRDYRCTRPKPWRSTRGGERGEERGGSERGGARNRGAFVCWQRASAFGYCRTGFGVAPVIASWLDYCAIAHWEGRVCFKAHVGAREGQWVLGPRQRVDRGRAKPAGSC